MVERLVDKGLQIPDSGKDRGGAGNRSAINKAPRGEPIHYVIGPRTSLGDHGAAAVAAAGGGAQAVALRGWIIGADLYT